MVDTHCHIFLADYPDIDDVIKRMDNNIIIVSGVDDASNKEVLRLCSMYDNVYGTLGIHPESANDNYDLDFISNHINDPKIVAVGEIGLDYYYTKETRDEQIDLFCRQIEIAISNNKPIVVHSRDAISDTYDIIKKYDIGSKTDIHCFSGSLEMAREFIKLGCKLGIGGVITFKNSGRIKDVVKNVDISNLLLETDSPYMTPVPFRGKRNEPYNIRYVAEAISDIKGISLDDVLKITSENAYKLFNFNK
jgi:TatD DNase family protein